jgi:hypothetical protein
MNSRLDLALLIHRIALSGLRLITARACVRWNRGRIGQSIYPALKFDFAQSIIYYKKNPAAGHQTDSRLNARDRSAWHRTENHNQNPAGEIDEHPARDR